MEEDIYRQIGSTEVDKAWEDLGTDCEHVVILRLEEAPLIVHRSSWCHFVRRRLGQWIDTIVCPTSSKVRRGFHSQRRRNASFALLGNFLLPSNREA